MYNNQPHQQQMAHHHKKHHSRAASYGHTRQRAIPRRQRHARSMYESHPDAVYGSQHGF
jgi:hypothetical protein